MGREQQQEEQHKQENTRIPDFSSPDFVVTKSRWDEKSRGEVLGDETSFGRKSRETKSQSTKSRETKSQATKSQATKSRETKSRETKSQGTKSRETKSQATKSRWYEKSGDETHSPIILLFFRIVSSIALITTKSSTDVTSCFLKFFTMFPWRMWLFSWIAESMAGIHDDMLCVPLRDVRKSLRNLDTMLRDERR